MFSESRAPKSLRQILTQYCSPSEELVGDFEKCARFVKVPAGVSVIRQGEMCTDMVFNRNGLFRVSNICDGTEDTVLFGTSGDVFTSMHSYYGGEASIFSLVAVEDSEAWLVSYDDMRVMQERHPELVRWMNGLMTEQLYGFEKRYLCFNNKSAESRFLNFLHIHSETLRRTPVKYISGIVPLKYIAQYLKITQSTLSRLRRKLVSRETAD